MTSTISTQALPLADGLGGERDDPVRRGLLERKLQTPQPGLQVLQRPRVDALLDAATMHRVALVSGPAGAGKTVACASWASAGPPIGPVAWLTCGTDDRGDSFWVHLWAALARTVPAGSDALAALEVSPAREFPLRLVAAAQEFTHPVVLVLDDVHELADGSVLGGLDMLVRDAPPALRVVLVTRRPLALRLGRLRVAGELADIGARDLACTAAEAAAYFSMLGVEVGAPALDEVLTRTEGWVTGLRLAALGAGGGSVAAVSGAQPLVSDYLASEVLARQGSHTRAFMARTAIAAEVSADLAGALTGEAGSDGILARLARESGFVCVSANRGRSYRYHPLLRDVLLDELHRTHPHEVGSLYRRAACWYALHDRPAEALRCAVESHDPEHAAQMLGECGVAVILTAGPSALEPLLGGFPEARTTSNAAVAGAWAAIHLWRGDTTGAARCLDSAQAALGRAAPVVREVMEPTVRALRVMCESEAGAPGQAVSCQASADEEQLVASTRAGHQACGLGWFALGVTAVGRGDMDQASHALRHAEHELRAGGRGPLRSRVLAWLAVTHAWSGALASAEETCAELGLGVPGSGPGAAALTCPDPAAGRPGHRYVALLALARVKLARDDLPGAQRLLSELDSAQPEHIPGEPSVAALAGLLRARVLLAKGDPSAAGAVTAGLRAAQSPRRPLLSAGVRAVEVEGAVLSGDRHRARALLPQADPDGGRRGTAALAVLHGRVLLAEENPRGALEAVSGYLSGGGGTTPVEQTAALLVAAVARRRMAALAEAAGLAERALDLAQREGAYRVFLDGGRAVRSVLTTLVPPTSTHAAFAGEVLARFATASPLGADTKTTASIGLTASERAVLSLLPSHMTNAEISQELFLSVNTVKTHLRTTYRKLGVRSRREAVAQGRQLGLLLATPGTAP
ncbi:MAG TPA: LuxR C-terminal-related transcriptional regulator, partial [Streptosporangiaceae bacterium]|nr:LuxR C-terminal-related transcriptional regulator [Streptosporangiaceae bacterium]